MKTNGHSREISIFLILTFAFSWVVWGGAILSGLTFNDSAGKLLYLLGACGPSILGVVLHYRYRRNENNDEFWKSLVDFRRVSPGWWILLLFAYPLIAGLACLLSLAFGQGLPGASLLKQIIQNPVLLLPNLVQFLVAGPLAEELGWRGFALPRMFERMGKITASLLLSLIWWAWHLPLFFFPGSTHFKFGWFTPEFWLFLATVVALGLVIGLAYGSNRNSLLAAVTMHFVYNLTMNLISPVGTNLRLSLVILGWLGLAAGLAAVQRKPAIARS
jgi:membrane protease YdiL (CAAX protease family)